MFNILRWDSCIWFIDKVGNAYYFEVGLWLEESRRRNAIIIGSKRILDIFFNFLEIRIQSYIISRNDNIFVIYIYKVSTCVEFDTLESPIDIGDMRGCILSKSFTKITVHGDDNLFSRWTFGSHVESWFQFIVWAINDFLDGVNFLVRKIGESLLNFQGVHCDIGRIAAKILLRGWSLDIQFLHDRFFDFFEKFRNFLNFFQ